MIVVNINTLDGDVDGNGNVNFIDLKKLEDMWLWTGAPGSILEDAFKDGSVDFLDFAALAKNWKE